MVAYAGILKARWSMFSCNLQRLHQPEQFPYCADHAGFTFRSRHLGNMKSGRQLTPRRCLPKKSVTCISYCTTDKYSRPRVISYRSKTSDGVARAPDQGRYCSVSFVLGILLPGGRTACQQKAQPSYSAETDSAMNDTICCAYVHCQYLVASLRSVG
jgi:hypothetical protein